MINHVILTIVAVIGAIFLGLVLSMWPIVMIQTFVENRRIKKTNKIL